MTYYYNTYNHSDTQPVTADSVESAIEAYEFAEEGGYTLDDEQPQY